MSLARKLVAPQLLILMLIGAMALTEVLVARGDRHQLELTTQRLHQTGLRIQRLGQLFSDTERELLSEVVTRKDLLTRRIVLSNEEIGGLLEELARASPGGSPVLEDLRRLRAPLLDAQQALLDARSPAENRSAFVRWWFLDQRATALLADLSASNFKGLDRILAEVAESRRRSDLFLLTLTGLCALTITGMTVYVVRGVVRPLVRLTRASHDIGNGRVIPRLEGRTDEIGTLSQVLAETTERLTTTNAQLQDALVLRDRFMSIAAHELRTPMTSLSLQIALLQRRIAHGADRESLRENARSLARQSQRLAQLVGELLDVSLIQAGRLELHPEAIRMDALVREVCARCAPLLDVSQNALTLAIEEEVLAQVDPSRLDQVLVNLLGNAARHAPGADVEVKLWTDGSQLHLRVRDSGAGIPETVRSQLFQPFARSSAATPGLGLGLHISREIVEAHGGRIEVQTAPGEGTAFTVHLPRAEEPRSAAGGEAPAA